MAITATFVSAALLGCGDEADGHVVPVVSVNELTTEELTSLPVGSQWQRHLPFGGEDGTDKIIYDAWQQSIIRCMARQGFEYEPFEYRGVPPPPLHPLDVEAARHFGYWPPEPPYVDPNRGRTEGSDAYRLALYGTPDRPGCTGNEQDRILGSLAWYIEAETSALSSFMTYIGDFATTEEGTQLASEWSKCMSERGYDYDTPKEPRAEFEHEGGSDREIAVRMADLHCDEAVELTRARSAYERRRVDEWLDANATLVQSMTEQYERFLEQVGELEHSDPL